MAPYWAMDEERCEKHSGGSFTRETAERADCIGGDFDVEEV